MSQKSQEIDLRHSVIRGWLERGMRTSSVSTMVQARFGISRTAAYRDIATVSQAIQASDDGPAEGEDAAFCPDTVLASLQHQMDISTAVGDVKSQSQLVKAMDTVLKWRGYHTTTWVLRSFQPFNSH